VATAALVIFTLLASVVAVAALHGWSDVLVPAPLLSRIASLAPRLPVPNAPSAVATDTVLMRAMVDTVPAEAGWASIDRTILPPGAGWAFDANDGEGPLLYRVESGQLTIRAEGPIAVTRGGASQAHPFAPGTDVVLDPGDQGFTPSGVASRWRNDGDNPAVILDARIMTLRESPPPAGISRYSLVYHSSFTPPSSPFVFTVHQVTLPPGAALRVDAVPGLRLLAIESGYLEARDPRRPDGFRVVNGAGADREFPPGRVFQAAGEDPVTLLLMTTTDSNPLQTPPLS
jgi:hypothetical protein